MQVKHFCTKNTFTIHCFKCTVVNAVSVLVVFLYLDITELQFPAEDNINNKPESNNSTSDIHSLSKLISNSSSEKLVSVTPSLQSTSSKSSSTTTVNSQVKCHSALNDSTSNNASRSRRQDWCKWPICIQYRTTGYCPGYNSNAVLPSFQMCQAAHIGPNDQVPLSSDGQVRVCFDSMGLVNLTCNRSDCYFYHPPKEIRDKIVAKRHAQYLREKVIRDASKSRKSTGLLTIDNNSRHFDYNTSNHKTILSQNQLTTSPIYTTIHQQSLIPQQQFFGTIDILSMNKDNLHNITSDYNIDRCAETLDHLV
ncbi:muscleblind 1 [Schistosoma japonicum]|uniref:Muscleblind 1 n=1 Tax=Schistosoma japonicum TaxID=6182 RepID=A0A4Z2DSV6_SCHJA|nr:muscleblind 1 [Schistosoma japonicum]